VFDDLVDVSFVRPDFFDHVRVVEQAFAKRRAGVGEAHPSVLAAEGKVLVVDVQDVGGDGVNDLAGHFQRCDGVGGVAADPQVRAVHAADHVQDAGGGDLFVGFHCDLHPGILEFRQHVLEDRHRFLRGGAVAGGVDHGAHKRRAEDAGDVQEPSQVVRSDALGAQLQGDSQPVRGVPHGSEFRVSHGLQGCVVANLEQVHAQLRGPLQDIMKAQWLGDLGRELPEEGVTAQPNP
jgi:hypothetical protein